MAVPELVVQNGVKLAWELLEQYPKVIGFLLRYLPIKQQEEYKVLLQNDNMSTRVVFSYPKGMSMLPSTTIVPQSKQEDVQFINDGGIDSYDISTLPHPIVDTEDFPAMDTFYGLLSGLTTNAEYLHKDGDRSTSSTEFHDQIILNRGIQRSWGDNQRKEMGAPQKVFNAMTQYVEGRSVIDRVVTLAQVRTSNGEKTLVYADMLMSVLREFSFWFHLNGLMNPIFSMGGMHVDSALGPSTSGEPPLMREISMSFQHEDRFYKIRPVIAKFILDVNMITLREDETEDSTQVASVETAGTSVSPAGHCSWQARCVLPQAYRSGVKLRSSLLGGWSRPSSLGGR